MGDREGRTKGRGRESNPGLVVIRTEPERYSLDLDIFLGIKEIQMTQGQIYITDLLKICEGEKKIERALDELAQTKVGMFGRLREALSAFRARSEWPRGGRGPVLQYHKP